ncbi:MAG: lytic transglycosylase domain-containing protein [Rhizobiaceae bacterium]
MRSSAAARRHPLVGLLLVSAAMMPVAACRANVDSQVTAAIPAAAAAAATPVAARAPLTARGDVTQLKNGLDALSSGRVSDARAVRDGLAQNDLDRHILAWAIAMRGGTGVSSGEIAAASRALAGWPGQTTLRRNFESALFSERPSPQAVIGAFAGTEPLTTDGTIALARAHVALGNRKAALDVLAPFWRTKRLDGADEGRIIAEFGGLIPASDHRIRMERMLYADRIASAQRVANLAGAKPLADAWAAASRGDANAARLLAAVPSAQRSAGYSFAQARLLRRQEKFAQAAEIMLKAPRDRASLVDPDAWWIERRVLSRELLDKGDARNAYRVAAAHAAESPVNQADAEFHAGWYALRALKDAKAAQKHFARIAEVAEGPISRSRAYYWQGRAAEAGGGGDAKGYYRRAAAYGTTFYGQLAAERIGDRKLNVAYPSPSASDRATFTSREAVTAIARLEQAGRATLADRIYMELAGELKSPGELAQLAAMAERRGNHFLALKVGKIAAGRGLDIGALSHPVGAIPATADISGSGKALAYAIARQESEFNISAVSSAGALGLLQLMPGTAQQVAKKSGVPFSKARLTTDAGYNAMLGANYLGEQIGRFNGSYILTFIGYNAGPSRASQWVGRYGDPRGKDIDTVVDWIERIPFTETRSYVQRVMENYQVYKMRLTGSYDIEGDLINGR